MAADLSHLLSSKCRQNKAQILELTLCYKTNIFCPVFRGFQTTIRKLDHLTTGHVWIILIDLSGIQMVTVYNMEDANYLRNPIQIVHVLGYLLGSLIVNSDFGSFGIDK